VLQRASRGQVAKWGRVAARTLQMPMILPAAPAGVSTGLPCPMAGTGQQ